ncbi:hypothetical protein EW146_g1329, partial [Bondarzewia mesenterica]
MGNSNSTQAPQNQTDRVASRRSQPALAPSASSTRAHTPHRSLRTKKKSLELPDLASLSAAPAASLLNSPNASYHRPKPSSPIPIPVSPNNAAAQAYSRPTQLPSTAQMPDVLLAPPSTHIPVYPPSHRPKGSRVAYSSTRSFASKGHPPPPPSLDQHPEDREPPPFVTETVRSTIPLGLNVPLSANGAPSDRKAQEDQREHIPVKISWRGGGKSVLLARAGDANWKGRQAMERDPDDDSWFTWVPLMPGTHHFKFIVDDQWRVAHSIPTAVDDDGSLANYVDVSMSGFTPPTLDSDTKPKPSAFASGGTGGSGNVHQISFWSEGSTTGGGPTGPPKWTQELPSELIAAAREEEAYLADGAQASMPAPNVPPAPVLPRHLDKLILNT